MEERKLQEGDDDTRMYQIKRRGNIVPYKGTISVFVLNDEGDKSYAEEIERELKTRNIKVKRSISEFSTFYEKEINVFREVTYMIVLVSENFLNNWQAMETLLCNYKTQESNEKIIPLIVDDLFYNPIEKTKAIKKLEDEINQCAKEYFDENYNGDIAEDLRKMQRIAAMIKEFIKFSLKRDKKSDNTLSLRIRNYVKHDMGIDLDKGGHKDMENYNSTVNINCEQINIAHENATINVIQNKGVNTSELESIIKGIMANLSKLKQEDADKITDLVEMVQTELAQSKPKPGRLKNCLALIAPMLSVANGIPELTANLNGLQEFIKQLL